ncbi:hypothetical protein [Streptomyces sp. NPDC087787]|uniref:hypothetical protein n=1 Tax=Streptomyces sp. NPDC087787 TaxID=3365803 RepID=UPI0038265468
MATYSGNVLRMKAPERPHAHPSGPDSAHAEPSGMDALPQRRQDEITVRPDLGAEYAGLTLEDGVERALMAGQPGIGWDAASEAMHTPGDGSTPAGIAPAWLAGDPHNAGVDTSFASAARGAIAGSRHRANISRVHGVGDDSRPGHTANPVGVAGTSFLEREAGFPQSIGAEPTGPGADKFIAGTNSWSASNPEGDQFAAGRGGGRAHFGFETGYFVHTPMYQDRPAQTYDRRTAPPVSRDPRVGGTYPRTPQMGQLAANPWLTELGESVTPSGYGVPVDGSI